MSYAKQVSIADNTLAAKLAQRAGELWFRQANNPAQALEALTWSVSLDGSIEETQTLLTEARQIVVDTEYRAGLAAFNKQDLDGAIAHWTRVLEIDPDHTNALANKAQAEDLKEKLSIL